MQYFLITLEEYSGYDCSGHYVKHIVAANRGEEAKTMIFDSFLRVSCSVTMVTISWIFGCSILRDLIYAIASRTLGSFMISREALLPPFELASVAMRET